MPGDYFYNLPYEVQERLIEYNPKFAVKILNLNKELIDKFNLKSIIEKEAKLYAGKSFEEKNLTIPNLELETSIKKSKDEKEQVDMYVYYRYKSKDLGEIKGSIYYKITKNDASYYGFRPYPTKFTICKTNSNIAINDRFDILKSKITKYIFDYSNLARNINKRIIKACPELIKYIEYPDREYQEIAFKENKSLKKQVKRIHPLIIQMDSMHKIEY